MEEGLVTVTGSHEVKRHSEAPLIPTPHVKQATTQVTNRP